MAAKKKGPSKKVVVKAPGPSRVGRGVVAPLKGGTPHRTTSTTSRRTSLDQLIASVNKAAGADVIRRASDATTSHTLRRPTGIPCLDIALAGGFPGGALCVVTGPDGAGKDYIINCAIRELQRIYGEETRVAIFSTEFPYDKVFAKDICGVAVGFTDEEIAEIEHARQNQGLDPLTAEEHAHYKREIGEILLIQGVIADHGLNVVLKCLETGAFQLIAINSLGVFETAAKEDVEDLQEHAIQSNEAQLLSRFIPKMFMLLNRPLKDGTRNETSLLAANQVRANRDMPRMKPGMPIPASMRYQPASGSKALAHGKAIDVMLHKGSVIVDKELDPPQVLGRTINWELAKGKLGTHDSKKGSYDFYFDGGADLASSLLSEAVRLGVIEQGGAWYGYQDGVHDFRAQGVDAAKAKLFDPEVFRAVYAATMKAAGIVCRYR